MEVIIKGQLFKQYKNTLYYVSKTGAVYSAHSHRILKGQIRTASGKSYKYIDILNKSTGKQQHINVHKMVYTAWVREPQGTEQVNHINDDSLDNRLENLYIGTQQENVQDCIKNNHRIGHMFYLTIFDKKVNKVLTFCPSSDFIQYCGHSNKNGCLNKFFNKNWFKIRYDIIEFKPVNNLQHYQNVTTMGDECSPVE